MINYIKATWNRFKKNHWALMGLTIVVFFCLLACFGPWISGYSYFDISLDKTNLPPSLEFWFGSDDLGRDLFTRVCYGARISLTVGLSAALIDLIIGVLWGSIAACAGGYIDQIMMRIADILYALPYLLVVTVLMVSFGSSLLTILIAMSIIGWITMARIVRGQILLQKNQDYILAAKALGASFSRSLFRHMIPNIMGPIIVTVTMTIPSAIFVEAFLSFLGLGLQAPISSWGTLASDGLPALEYYPWRLLFPAFFITITMLAFNLIGDGLRDAFDSRNLTL
jgi:oligopeptide transport system permease protein